MKKIYLLFLFLLISYTLLTAQTKAITGSVTGSEDNMPVIGCTVQLKGTTTSDYVGRRPKVISYFKPDSYDSQLKTN